MKLPSASRQGVLSKTADKIFKRRVHSFTNIHAAHCCSLFIGDTHAFLTTWLFRFDPNLLFWWHSLLWLPNRFYWIFLQFWKSYLNCRGIRSFLGHGFHYRFFQFSFSFLTFFIGTKMKISIQLGTIQMVFTFDTDWILVGKILVVQNFWFVGLIQNLLEEFCYWLFCVLLWTSLVIWTF